MRTRRLVLVLVTLLAACAGSGDGAEVTSDTVSGVEAPRPAELGEVALRDDARDEVGPTRATRESTVVAPARDQPGAIAQPDAPGAIAQPDAPDAPDGAGERTRALFVLNRDVRPAEAEDGRGGIVSARDPIAFDVDARRVPPGARDPVLFVGALRFERYAHPRPGVLRFVCADRALLAPGVEVAVQYGDDEDTRVVLTRSLEVSP